MPCFTRSAVALACAGAIALSSSGASAYCRATTKAVPPDWNLATQGCFGSAANPDAKDVYWKNRCVGYSLQKDASRQVSLDQATAIVGSAFNTWSNATCIDGLRPSIGAVDLGPVDCATVQYNDAQPNQNVIVFRDDVWPYGDAGSTLGRTTVTFLSATGEIVGADMEINGTQPLSASAVAGAPAGYQQSTLAGYDLSAIVLHEVGHFLGLGHSARADATMYASYQTAVRPLSDDDADGICAAYASNGVRVTAAGQVAGQSCDPTPRHGFSSACATPGGDQPDSAPSKRGGCAVQASGPIATIAWWPSALLFAWLARRRSRAQSCASIGAQSVRRGPPPRPLAPRLLDQHAK